MIRLRALDGWRGVGAIVIALAHLELAGFSNLGIADLKPYVLVDYFFVLSGFVMAMVYGGRLTSGREVGIYLIKRTGRIWPLHAVVLGAFVSVELAKLAAMTLFDHQPTYPPFSGSRPVETIGTNLLLLHAFGLDDGLGWNFPSWSVAAEFWVYAVFGLAMLALGGKQRPMILAAAVAAAVAAFAIVLFSPNRMNATHDFGAVRGLYGFSVGVLAHAVWTRGWSSRLGGSAVEVVAAITVFTYAFLAQNTAVEYAAPLVFALVLLVFVGDRGVVSRVLSTGPIQALGRWSYSIYMVHALIITAVMPHLAPAILAAVGGDLTAAGLLSAAIFLTIVVGLSAATYRLVEGPGQVLFGRLADRLKPARRPLAAPVAAE